MKNKIQLILILLIVVVLAGGTAMLMAPKKITSKPKPVINENNGGKNAQINNTESFKIDSGKTYVQTIDMSNNKIQTFYLNLADEGKAILRKKLGDTKIVLSEGSWEKTDNDEIVVNIDGSRYDYIPTNGPVPHLALQGHEDEFGGQSLKLTDVDELTNGKWTWVETKMGEGKVTKNDKKEFTLSFAKDGGLQVGSDCNSGSGKYTLPSPGKISLDQIATTTMFCDGSKESDYFMQLGKVEGMMLRDNKLYLQLKDDAGYMSFKKQ
ncbi:MAG: META domain-containing protein [Patescibacteria group bacterium]